MTTVFTLFMILIMIASILLIIVVMAQNPKGGGLSSAFGGASSVQFGVQRTNDFMEKATWTLAATIGLLCLLSVILTAKKPVGVVNPNGAPAKNTRTTAPTTGNAPAAIPTTSGTGVPVTAPANSAAPTTAPVTPAK